MLLAENLSVDAGLIVRDNINDATITHIPTIEFRGTFLESNYVVVVDGTEICDCAIFIEAIKVWFSTFFTFDLTFPKEIFSVLNFLQKFVLKMEDNSKTVKKVLNFQSKLCRV